MLKRVGQLIFGIIMVVASYKGCSTIGPVRARFEDVGVSHAVYERVDDDVTPMLIFLLFVLGIGGLALVAYAASPKIFQQ